MEKKHTLKAAVAKKTVASKEIKLKADTTPVATSPVKKRAAKSEPGAPTGVETGSAKQKITKTVRAATPKKAVKATLKKVGADVTAEIAVAEPKVALSPVFKALAEPILPELTHENRARLLMQTPTRLYFYWAVKENPWAMLKQAFGSDTGSYTLVLKLTNLRRDSEEIHPCDAAGNWWFDVEPDSEYQAEIGFYAPNRPYFRVIYSNRVETPRRSPSPRAATDADWNVSAGKFAEVLDVAGFTRDAFDVALAGDDYTSAESATHTAFSQFAGDHDLHGIAAEDIRYAMRAIASGATLEDLRFKISRALFAILSANADKIVAGKAMTALGEYFDIDEAEFVEEQLGSAVYGASLVHFPKTLKTRRVSSKTGQRYSPISSFGLGR